MSSKEIARQLNISPHTVDQRIKIAIGHLGVTSRVEAAKLLAAHEDPDRYQTPLYQAPDITPSKEFPDTQLGKTPKEQALNEASHAEAVVNSSPSPEPYAHGRWPFPLAEGNRNSLTIAERLIWIFIIAIGAALGFGMILAGMDALSRLV